jgi:hypothetical protein
VPRTAAAALSTLLLSLAAGCDSGDERAPAGGKPADPCYHRACDRLGNVDPAVLVEMARAAAGALRRLSARERG